MNGDLLHVGVILDGNRRFAKKLMKEPWKGHEFGKKKIEQLLEWNKELGVGELTLYAFSMQNFNRPKLEFEYLMKLFRETFLELADDKDERIQQVRIHFIGRIQLFPEDIQKLISQLEENTKNNGPFKLNLCMAYGGREEMTDGMKQLAKDVKEGKLAVDSIDEKKIGSYLQLQSEPDFIIRTGGEIRTSNFLIWQSWYSEWFFLEKTWPEFEKEDLQKCISEFKSRDRRMGT